MKANGKWLSKKKINKNLFVCENYLFLNKGLIIEDDDNKLLEKWFFLLDINYKNQENKTQETPIHDEEKMEFMILNEEKKNDLTQNVILEVNEFVKNNIEEILNKNQSYKFPHIKKIKNEIKRANEFNSDQLVLLTNLFSDTNKSFEILTKSMIYLTLLSEKLNLDQTRTENLIVANLLSEIFYLTHPIKILTKNINIVNLDFKPLKEHITKGFKKIKKIENINNQILNIVVLHHEHIDGSGILGLNKNKISLQAQMLAIVQEFLYLTTGYLKKNFKIPSLSKGIIIMYKNKERFLSTPFNAFLSLNPLYPLGEILKLKDQSKDIEFYGIVIKKSKHYKFPIVKILSKKPVGYSQIIDLSELGGKKFLIKSVLDNGTEKDKLHNLYKKENEVAFE